MRPLVQARALALVAALCLIRATSASAQALEPCGVRTPERVVAVGDVHGAYDAFVAILREAGLVDARARWTGGRAILVQTGDVLDRGGDSRKVLDLLRRLERDAQRAGGRVFALLGNHEVMRMVGDWRYVSEGEYAAFRSADSRERREAVMAAAEDNARERARQEQRPFDAATFRTQFLEDIPLGFLEMRQAFSQRGDYGRWLRTHVAAVTINGMLFVHGGISPEVATRGCAGINEAVAADLRVESPTPQQAAGMFSSLESGPLWYRGLTAQPDALAPEAVDAVLAALGVRALVIGHTVTEDNRITPRYDGRVIQIDTGMLAPVYTGGIPSALEIKGRDVTALYVGRPRAPVAAPALTSTSAAR